LFELAFNNCRDALIIGSLSTQEVSMAVQSIRTPVQVRHIAGNQFFMTPSEVAFREMDGVRELDYLTQEVGTRAEAFDNTWDLRPPGSFPPEVISFCSCAGRVGIFGNSDFGFGHVNSVEL
jgi:hypothetical protein